MDDLPSRDVLLATLTEHWGVPPESVRPCAKSGRLFEIKNVGFARVVFARGPLSAVQMVDLVDYLSEAECAAPRIVRTIAGALAVGFVPILVETAQAPIVTF